MIPPQEVGFERFEENKLDSATIPEEQEQEEEKQEQEQEHRSTVDAMRVWIIFLGEE